MMSQDVVERTKAAIAQGSEASLRNAWHEAKKLEPAQGWRLGVEILEALDMDVRAFTWAPLMLEGAEVHVLPNVLKGPWLPSEEAGSAEWQKRIDGSIDRFVRAGYLVRLGDGHVDLGPGLPPLPDLSGCVGCLDEGYCLACEGDGSRLGEFGFGDCPDCKGTGQCPCCGAGHAMGATA